MFFPRLSPSVHSLLIKIPGIFVFTCGLLALFEASSRAASINVSGGPRFSVLGVERSGKLDSGQHLHGESQEEGFFGLALNMNAGRWFLGSEFSSGNASYKSDSIKDPGEVLSGSVDITEINVALGFLVFREFGPFLAFTSHKQNNPAVCPGCKGTFQFSEFGPGLSLNTPFPRSRWGGFARGSIIKGYNWEAGFSYSMIRWPLMGVLGFRQRVIHYSPGEVPCIEGVPGCFLSRDIISGPVFSVYAIF